jgi:SAM-dependent methyltransferase
MNVENTDETLTAHRKLWDKKPVLREIYTGYYTLIQRSCVAGRVLEIGGGSGNFKEFLSESISVDIVTLPWLDAIADAQTLPFKDHSFSNIVMVDVLHHIEHPAAFFREADRVLIPGGRLICIEPAITPVSWIFLHFFHPEPIDMGQNPFIEFPPDPARKPFDANQAIPTLLFKRYLDLFEGQFPDMKIIRVSYLDLFAYPLSGGFRPWCLIPGRLIKPVLKAEKILMPTLGPLMAFRLYCVVKKEERFNNKNQHE